MSPLSEARIELYVECRMNWLDRQFMSGQISRPTYERAVQQLDQWSRSSPTRVPC